MKQLKLWPAQEQLCNELVARLNPRSGLPERCFVRAGQRAGKDVLAAAVAYKMQDYYLPTVLAANTVTGKVFARVLDEFGVEAVVFSDSIAEPAGRRPPFYILHEALWAPTARTTWNYAQARHRPCLAISNRGPHMNQWYDVPMFVQDSWEMNPNIKVAVLQNSEADGTVFVDDFCG